MTQGRRKWTAEQKAAASLAGKERFAKKWAERYTRLDAGTIAAASEFVSAPNPVIEMRTQTPFEAAGTSEAPHGVVATIPYTADGQTVMVTPAFVERGKEIIEEIKDRAVSPEEIYNKEVFAAVAGIEEPIRDAVRVGSREVVLRVRTDGQMVSMQGPCLCGAVKREWHQICLKTQ